MLRTRGVGGVGGVGWDVNVHVNHGCRNGGPYYTKKATHKHLKGQPVGKNKKATVAGTQSLDGWWKSPKMNLQV